MIKMGKLVGRFLHKKIYAFVWFVVLLVLLAACCAILSIPLILASPLGFGFILMTVLVIVSIFAYFTHPWRNNEIKVKANKRDK